MARYVQDRRRTLRGLGTTFSFVPRGRTLRGLRGLGDDSTDIDVVTGLPCDDPRANCGPLVPAPTTPIDTTMIPAPTTLNVPPPSFFTSPKPIIPAPVVTQVQAPTFTPSIVPPSIVFPSGGTTRPLVTAPPSASWLDQEMIGGVPNKYLALGTVGAILLFGMSAKRRR